MVMGSSTGVLFEDTGKVEPEEKYLSNATYSSAKRMWSFEPGETNVLRALDRASMAWEVETRPMYYDDAAGGRVISKDRAVVRRDTGAQLGRCTERYRCSQNRDVARLFEPLLETGKWSIDAMGLTTAGRVWITARSDGDVDVTGKGDRVVTRLIGHWRHDGGTAVTFQHLPMRIVCSNMVQRAIRDSAHTGMLVRHFGDVGRALGAMRGIMNQIAKVEAEDVALMIQLAKKRLATPVADYFRMVIPAPAAGDYSTEKSYQIAKARHQRVLGDIQMRYDSGKGLDVCDRGNYWAAYNAITESVDHQLGMAKKRDYVDYALFGDGARIRSEAFERALAA